MTLSNKHREQKTENFIGDIINGMYDWVRVVDPDNNIIYMNKAMSEGIRGCLEGNKCFHIFGNTAPCENCISRKSQFNGTVYQKEEIIGEKVFSIMSSPVRNEKGEIIAAVEVLRDVTQLKELQEAVVHQNKALQQDLEIAKKLQRSLLPKEFNEDRVKFAYLYNPSETLGGDFLDVFKITPDHIGIYIADVSGHGVPASMLTVFLRSRLSRKLLSPSAALEKLYADFNNNNIFDDLYITVFYAIIDLKNNILTFSNAGHNVVPILFSNEKFRLLCSAGLPISNWMPNPDYSDKSVPLTKGDRLFLYTDGIIEAKNNQKEQFGEERLLEVLLNNTLSPEDVLDQILGGVKEFVGDKSMCQVCDDITMALVELV